MKSCFASLISQKEQSFTISGVLSILALLTT
ncbi:unnamed protein product, partial [marine sediment metagenome]